MKSLVIVSCLIAVATVARGNELPGEFDVLKESYLKCAAEQGFTPEDMPKPDDQNLTDEQKHKIGCLDACVMKDMGVMADSKIDSEKMAAKMNEMMHSEPENAAATEEIVRKCVEDGKAGDECETAKQVSDCIKEQLKGQMKPN